MKVNITAGIDFGNQNCVLSIPTEKGIDIISNQSSNRKTPTMVTYGENRRYAGEFSLQQQMMEISNTITQIKQLIGLRYNSTEREELSKQVPFKLVSLEDGSTAIQLENSKILRPEQVMAFLLKSLIDIIKTKNPKITQVLLTVSPWMDEVQRRALINAAAIADIKITTLLDTSTAAALAYVKIHGDRFPEEQEKAVNVALLDIGDTSMNVGIVKVSKHTVEMKSVATTKEISGQLFTQLLEKYLLEKVQQKYKIDPTTNKRAMIRFQQACEKAKKTLSANNVVVFEIQSLMNDIDVSITIKREEFNNLIQPYLEKIKPIVEEALQKASITKEDVVAIEILGGGSRVPAVKNEIKEIFGRDPNMSLDLDECFAIGAGYMAAVNDGFKIGVEVANHLAPYQIKAEWEEVGKESKKSFYHAILCKEFHTHIPIKVAFKIPITEKKTFAFKCNNHVIGVTAVNTRISETVDVHFEVSIDHFGIATIYKAFYVEDGKKHDVHYSYCPLMTLTSETITQFSKIEEEMTLIDKNEEEIDYAKNDLESLIFSTQNDMNALDPKSIPEKEIDEIKARYEKIREWFEIHEFDRLSLEEYKEKIKEISEIHKDIHKNEDKIKMASKLNELKSTLASDLQMVNQDKERLNLPQSVTLRSQIQSLSPKIDEIIESNNFNEEAVHLLEKEVKQIDSNAQALKEIPIPKEKKIKKKVQSSKPQPNQPRQRSPRRQINDPWSQLFGQRGGFGDTWGPFGRSFNQEQTPESSSESNEDEPNEKVNPRDMEEEEERERLAMELEAERQRKIQEAERQRKLQEAERKRQEAEERRAEIEAEKQARREAYLRQQQQQRANPMNSIWGRNDDDGDFGSTWNPYDVFGGGRPTRQAQPQHARRQQRRQAPQRMYPFGW